MSKQVIAQQHTDFVAPFRVGRWFVPAGVGFVQNIVVNQCCGVNHLKRGSHLQRRLFDGAQTAG